MVLTPRKKGTATVTGTFVTAVTAGEDVKEGNPALSPVLTPAFASAGLVAA